MNRVAEKNAENRAGVKKSPNIKYMVRIAMLGAVAAVLMLFEIPLWFAPSFYEIDLSEVAVLVGTFSMGPLAGVLIELIKVLLNFVLNGTITAGVGELANFLMGCAFLIPAGLIYRRKKTIKGALLSMVAGTVSLTVAASILNAYMLLPAYAAAFMPMETILKMGNAVNPAITDLSTFVLYAVAPFNLLKGTLVSIVTFLLYKKISVVFKSH